MSADLHIHIYDAPGTELTETDMAIFFASTIGSAFGLDPMNVVLNEYTEEQLNDPKQKEAIQAKMAEVEEKAKAVKLEYVRRLAPNGTYPGLSHGARRPIDAWELAMYRVHLTPNIWIGEVSWLKAALFDDAKTYIPDPVAKISEVIGEKLPVIDTAIIEAVQAALATPNQTTYNVAHALEVVEFLTSYLGRRVFTVSW